MSFFFHIKEVIRFFQLPKPLRRVTIYSEGNNYWPHLKDLVLTLLNTTDIAVNYISSDKNDQGLYLDHPNLKVFKTDLGFVRNWFFENIDTDIFLMTMPDIDNFQVKRSKNKVHYIYTQHSLVSLHMIYRKHAFDNYDTVFCAGPHHLKEIRAMEKYYGLQSKNLVECGYPLLDHIRDEKFKVSNVSNKSAKNPLHVLVAPSWGPKGTIESGIGFKLIDKLLGMEYEVTLRPHPQTNKFAQKKIDEILNEFAGNSLFNYDSSISAQESLHSSDVLISDWSGVVFDYAFGLEKPVYFLDVPRKVNNEDYEVLGIEPFEVSIRNVIGEILDVEDFDFCFETIKKTEIEKYSKYYFRNASEAGVEAIVKILGGLND